MRILNSSFAGSVCLQSLTTQPYLWIFFYKPCSLVVVIVFMELYMLYMFQYIYGNTKQQQKYYNDCIYIFFFLLCYQSKISLMPATASTLSYIHRYIILFHLLLYIFYYYLLELNHAASVEVK